MIKTLQWLFVFLGASSMGTLPLWAQTLRIHEAITAVKPTTTQPKTPLSMILSTLNDPKFQQEVQQEETRFKLLQMGSQQINISQQVRTQENIQEHSHALSQLVMRSLKEEFQDELTSVLATTRGFESLIKLIKDTQPITSLLPKEKDRHIAMSFQPDPQKSSLTIERLLVDKINLAFNIQDQIPSIYAEQRLTQSVNSQVYYDFFLNTLDSALKKKINDKLYFHIINRNQFQFNKDKSVIFGISLQLH